MIRIDNNGNAHSFRPPLYDPAGFIPHPLQAINFIHRAGAINPNDFSGARVVTQILVPGHDFALSYNFPRRGGT